MPCQQQQCGEGLCLDRGIELQALQVRQYSLPTGPPQSINYPDETSIHSLLRESLHIKNPVYCLTNDKQHVATVNVTWLELMVSYQRYEKQGHI